MSAANTTAALSQSLKFLLPTKGLPPVLKPRLGNLYEVLSRTPTGGVGMKVHQTRWSEKNIGDSYWVVTRSQFKLQGQHGKAWGRLYWKGKPVSLKDERIPGSLKYTWSEGCSVGKALSMAPKKPQASSPKPQATP